MAALGDASRRQFLIYGTSSLALASIAARAQRSLEPLPAALGPSDAAVPAQDGAARTADAAGHLTVAVRIDNHGPYHFVVDTGADRTVLATDVAAETVTLRELAFGSVRCGPLMVPILPHSMLQADGYLGLDTLDGHRVTFDFKNHTLQVSEPRSRFGAFWLGQQNEARIRTVGSSGHLRALHCTVDGVPAAAFVDSGAEVSAGNPPLLAALARRNPAYSQLGAISVSGITGGETLGNVTLVKKIRLMDLEFTDCPLLIADFQIFAVWGLRQYPSLLIGMNLLRQFSKVSIDYGRKELRFDLASVNLLQST